MSRSAEVEDAAPLDVNGARLTASNEGALLWPERHTLIVADLHLEKGSAYAARGQFLPPYDTAATLARLSEVLRRFRPRRVICLGDSFHDSGAPARLSAVDGARIRDLTEACEDWIWICGNHDPAPPARWGGRVEAQVTLGSLVFRHEPADGRSCAGEVCGHFHPKAAIRVRSKRLTGRCFVTDGRRLILPAFGAYAGGLNVLDPAITGLLQRDFQVHLIGRRKIFAFPRGALAF